MGICDGLEYDVTSGTLGVKGPPGPQGAKGPHGMRGLQGERGKQGPQGERGPEGPIGPVGDKGIDGPPADHDTSPWQEVDTRSLLNGWQRSNTISQSTPAFRKTASGVVMLSGSVFNGIVERPIFQLPAGFTPQYKQLFLTSWLPDIFGTGNIWAVIEVDPDGGVICRRLDPSATSTIIDLSSVIFYGGQR